MSESKSPDGNDTEGIDELAELRAQHALSASSSIESVARARERLDEESKLRSGIRRERRMRITEMTERVSGMHGAMRKANEILFEERLQQIEADLRAELEDEMERLETEAIERRRGCFARRCYIGFAARRTGCASNLIWNVIAA
ncbi:MAG: hypothetical protein Ct9H300mP30_2420 [Methanobacteriota archaeon]|nr:MAG: hypothetical protein Ct9H300mP30_2420 [Euryarchaeota archaeon]